MQEMLVEGVDGGGVHPHQHLAGGQFRQRECLQGDNINITIAALQVGRETGSACLRRRRWLAGCVIAGHQCQCAHGDNDSGGKPGQYFQDTLSLHVVFPGQ